LTQDDPPCIASDRLPARSTGPWVFDKKYYFERYLDIFTRGVGPGWQGKLAYVDLFCGPGRSVVRGTGEEVDGSPLLSLRHKFSRYVFVDLPEALSILQARLQGHPKLAQIVSIEGDCNLVVDSIIKALPQDHLTLAFIDPTGLQIHFETIQKLARRLRIDLLMTIHFGMGIVMNVHSYAQSEGRALSEFLGTKVWREDLKQGGSASQVGRRILNRYAAQLERLGFTTVKDREIPIRSDQSNLLLYYIVLASRHPLAEKFWRKITQIGPSGQRLPNLEE
jgi:three-Cys-motif partner protein